MSEDQVSVYQYRGKCSCGEVQLALSLPDMLPAYTPRACDCDYCTARGIQYLSHPAGQLRVQSAQPLHEDHQGSGQACFYSCNQCGDLVAVGCEIGGRTLGTINATLLDDAENLPEALVVSPKQLAPEEKLARWGQVWMPLTFG